MEKRKRARGGRGENEGDCVSRRQREEDLCWAANKAKREGEEEERNPPSPLGVEVGEDEGVSKKNPETLRPNMAHFSKDHMLRVNPMAVNL